MNVMSSTHPLQATFELAAYRVRLARGGYATIRVGKPLPGELAALLPEKDACWAFITAWNPHGTLRSRKANRKAQRALVDTLHNRYPAARWHAGCGTLDNWREPSLFVTGLSESALDELMHRFGQLAVVSGCGNEPAVLRWSPVHG